MSPSKGDRPLSIDLQNASLSVPESPPIAALFVIYFDVKAGYTLGWRRSLPGIQLDGVVEYKSLPSGLHNVKEDLVYFVHEQYAGLSAFVNCPGPERSRNAVMLAVGVLVPLSLGRLGRGWRHAQKLKEFASKLVHQSGSLDTSADLKDLDQYWDANRAREGYGAPLVESPLDSPSSLRFKPAPRSGGPRMKGRARHRTPSDGTNLLPPGQTLTPFHPALSLPDFLDDFGPLVFPLQRAALLRKRILFVGHAPVEKACNYGEIQIETIDGLSISSDCTVYDLSIISNIPLSVNDLISTSSPAPRLRPLFTIGVHDIPLLEDEAKNAIHQMASSPVGDDDSEDEHGQGWVAFTTDEVLATKDQLYDVLVTMPPPHSKEAAEKAWPKVEHPRGTELKATQRDSRRYATLRRGLSRFSCEGDQQTARTNPEEDDDDDRARLLQDRPQESAHELSFAMDEQLVEPMSWPAVAYASYLWWASAGERRTDMDDEIERDDSLLKGLNRVELATPPFSTPSRRSTMDFDGDMSRTEGTGTEMALIAYFHRLTTLMLTTLADLIDSSEADEEEDDEAEVFVTREDVTRMGLDVWSARDREFVQDMAHMYFGKSAYVQGGQVECCGVRIC